MVPPEGLEKVLVRAQPHTELVHADGGALRQVCTRQPSRKDKTPSVSYQAGTRPGSEILGEGRQAMTLGSSP